MLIDVTDVSHGFDGGTPVLRDLSVRLDEPRIGVIGANGSGKSTFARMLNGLVVPEHGSVTIDGLDTARKGRDVRKRVGFCFTDPDSQIVMPTVAEDVAFGLRRRGLAKGEIAEQLLALASVLVTEPELLVMDEPTTLLDVRNARRVADLVRDLPQQVVLVTHHLDLLADFDRVLVFDDSRLVHDGTPADAVEVYLDRMAQTP